LESHKNRKTPCLIREVKPENANNPNRCIYCNKIFAKPSNLTKHHKICKIKNGGMEILVDKVKQEQEIRILKEQDRAKDVKIQELIKQNEEMIERARRMELKIEEISKQLTVPAVIQPPQIVNVNNGVVNNININVKINDYRRPAVEKVKLFLEDIERAKALPALLFDKIWFNKEIPENHSIYLNNKKTRELLVLEDNDWRVASGERADEILMNISNTIMERGERIVNYGDSPVAEERFTELLPPVQEKVRNFNMFVDKLSSTEAYDILIAKRDITHETIKASGCTLIK
jgi:hypothetical protein